MVDSAILRGINDPKSVWANDFRGFSRAAFSVACLLLMCSACGSSPQKAPVPASNDTSNHYVGTQPVYAELVRERGGSWVFTNVTDSDMPSTSGYLVRLNDLQPVFDIRAAECVPQVYPDSHRCSPLHPFRNKDTGMIDKIINSSIAVGTAGKVTDLSQTYETTFDEAAFNGAVDEALLNTGLDQDRRKLLSLIDTYEAEFSQSESDLRAIAQDVENNRRQGSGVAVTVQPKVSGITEYYQGDIDFAEPRDRRGRRWRCGHEFQTGKAIGFAHAIRDSACQRWRAHLTALAQGHTRANGQADSGDAA